VFETKGNVFEIWHEESKNNLPLSITDPLMKRYYFHINDGVEFILKCIPIINRGEILVPKMPMYSMKDLANQISKKHKIIGLRQGEKMNEVMITQDELKHATQKKDMWIIKQYS
jgi:UDP-N-acetylglucosamine 4,6-dehydratase